MTFAQQPQNLPRSRSQSRNRRGGGRGGARGGGRGRGQVRGKWHNYEAQIRDLKKKVDGPKEQDTFTLVVTAGIMQGNLRDGQQLQREQGTWLNPLHLKDPTSGETPTPLSTRAAQYALWKCKKLHVTLVPLVGSGVVAGSIGLISLSQNSDSIPPSNLAAIQARPHVEVAIGSRFTWRLGAKELEGPRQGWWVIDPGDEPSMSLGPQLEAWVYGHTINLFAYNTSDTVNHQYGEGLWRIEFNVTYAFSNYQSKIGLSNLPVADIEPNGDRPAAVFMRSQDGHLAVELGDTSFRPAILRCSRKMTYLGNGQSLSDVILGITDTVAAAVSNIPGWGWLLNAGYQFIRGLIVKEMGAPVVKTYYVYESLSAALDDRRIPVPDTFPRTSTVGSVEVQQLTNPNYGVPIGFESGVPGTSSVVRGYVTGDNVPMWSLGPLRYWFWPYQREQLQNTPRYGVKMNATLWQSYRGKSILLNDFLPMWCASWESPYGPIKFENPSPMMIEPGVDGTTSVMFYNNGGILVELLGKGMYGGLPTSPDEFWFGRHGEIQNWWGGAFERNGTKTGCLYRLISCFPILENTKMLEVILTDGAITKQVVFVEMRPGQTLGNIAGRVHDFTDWETKADSVTDLLADMSICDLEAYVIQRRYQLAESLTTTSELAADIADAMKDN